VGGISVCQDSIFYSFRFLYRWNLCLRFGEGLGGIWGIRGIGNNVGFIYGDIPM